jgi:hypothetical protein
MWNGFSTPPNFQILDKRFYIRDLPIFSFHHITKHKNGSPLYLLLEEFDAHCEVDT